MTDKMKPETHAKRSVWVDCARVIAAFLVVCVHTPLSTEGAFDYMDPVFLSGHVPSFYFLAGYFSRSDWSSSWRRAFFFLMVFIAWNAITMAIALYKGTLVFKGAGTLILLFTAFDHPFWFLQYLIIFFLFAPVFSRFRRHLIWGGALVLVLCGLGLHGGIKLGIMNINQYFYNSLAFFVIGMWFNGFTLDQLQGFLFRYRSWILFIAIAASAFLAFRQISPWVYCRNIWGAVGIAGIFALAVTLESIAPKIASWIAKCGESSFLVYAVHVPVLMLFGLSDQREAYTIPYWNYGLTLLFAALLFPVCRLAIWAMRRFLPLLMPLAGLKR